MSMSNVQLRKKNMMTSFLQGLQPMPMLRRMGGPVMMDAQPMMAFAAPMARNTAMAGAGPPPPQSPPRVRKLFPETWLWSNSTTG